MRIKDRLEDVISIVTPETLLAWNRRMKQKKWTFARRNALPGQPPKPPDTDALIVDLAENNVWGYVLPATLAAYKVPFCGRSVLVGVSEITI
jgi:hypothetical protein